MVMDSESYGRLAALGCAFGFVHVFSGADHLSALATLSVNTSWKMSLALGIQWGLGHSAGIVLVTVFFLSINLDLDKVSYFASWIVGIFLILLGGYGVFRARRVHKRNIRESQLLHTTAALNEDFKQEDPDPEIQDTTKTSQEDQQKLPQRIREQTTSVMSVVIKYPLIQKLIAFCVGVIHGVSGPGGILGVIPALEQNSWIRAMYYLSFFTVTSTLAMGSFAAIYGEITVRMGGASLTRMYHLNLFSSLLSLIIGIVWTSLLPFGVFDDVFH